WIQGAGLIKNRNNKAISSNRAGMVLFGSTLNQDYARPIKTIPVKNLPKELQQLFTEGQTEVDIRDIPFSTVKGFESYNATVGMRVWAHGTNFDGEGDFSSRPVGYRTVGQEPDTAHKGRSRVEDFKLWGNRYSGVEVFYSSNIKLKDGLVLGRDGENVSGGHGLFNNHAAFNSTFDNITVAGYRQGAEVEFPNSDADFNATTIKNSRFKNNTYNLGAYGDEAPMQDSDRTRPDDIAGYLKLQNNQFLDKASSNRAPVARFSVKSLGGLSVELNASASYDSDPLLPKDGKARAIPSKGIAAYAWDLNGDGKFDRFGRKLKHSFDKAGSREVSLTVVDTQGETKTIANTVAVQPTAYRNAFTDGTFNNGTPTQEGWKASSRWADGGWFASDNARIGGGVARLSQPGDWSEFIGRVITDEKVRKGQQKFSFRLKNKEGAPDKNYWDKNEVAIKLWGVNGPFENNPYEQTGPEQIGTLGMRRTALVDENFGGEGGEFFDWKNFSFDVDLGKGYDHLLFQVNTTRTKNAGDYVAIDNVALTGAPNSIAGGVPTLGGTSSPTRPQPVPPPVAPAPTPAPVDPPPATAPPTTPIVAAPTGNYAKPVVTLSFEEAIDKVAKDTSTEGGNNSGRYRGGLRPTKGKVGQAAALDGGRDVITLKNSKDINLAITPERTVSLWFQADDVTANKKQVIYEEGGAARGLNIYLEDNLLYFGGWNRAQSKWSDSWIKSNKVTSGKWHHLALVLDGESAVTDNAMTAYLDGQIVGQMEGSQLWSRSGGIGIGNVNKGTRFESGATKGTRNYGFMGAVDEFNLYNSALESSEVKQLASGFM
ncbi:MAG: LamG-like jellyroll fold domain-containing protein, partial [Cyanobacteria bacterium P01_F01_bin.53]